MKEKERAEELLAKYGMSVPVDVEKIAEGEGLVIVEYDFDALEEVWLWPCIDIKKGLSSARRRWAMFERSIFYEEFDHLPFAFVSGNSKGRAASRVLCAHSGAVIQKQFRYFRSSFVSGFDEGCVSIKNVSDFHICAIVEEQPYYSNVTLPAYCRNKRRVYKPSLRVDLSPSIQE